MYLAEKSAEHLTSMQSHILNSCLMRGDLNAAEQFVLDWNQTKTKKMHVSKWFPGRHYYALDKKFNTLGEAIEYLRKNGYAYSGLNVVSINDVWR